MRVANVTWRSSEPVGEIEGYILATYMRIKATGKPYPKRDLLASPSTTLTAKIVDAIAGPFAFTMSLVSEGGIVTTEGVDEAMRVLNHRRVLVWLNANEDKREQARAYLMGLVGKFTCTG